MLGVGGGHGERERTRLLRVLLEGGDRPENCVEVACVPAESCVA